jgi:asparagine synthase (glutamine-hydrolysing)
MCGVVATWRGPSATAGLRAQLHRGPYDQGEYTEGHGTLAHCRLPIIDTTANSRQPMTRGRTTLAFAGEIWNYAIVRAELERLGRTFTTTGDTEVFVTALDAWGIDALPRLEGMFAAAWLQDDALWLARDRFGEVPFHFMIVTGDGLVASTELKGFLAMGLDPADASWLAPGRWIRADEDTVSIGCWYELPPQVTSEDDLETAAEYVKLWLAAGVAERSIADVPVCTLLSGGIDSAAITSLFGRSRRDVVAYTAVYDQRSVDLRVARRVADYLEIRLVEVKVPAPTRADLAAVIGVIEMPYKAQVEIGWACLHLARAIAADGFRVTFSGEGSDELWGSYGFAYHAIAARGWMAARRGLVAEQAHKNFPRCNKVFLRHAVECRLPFLHRPLVEYALTLSQETVQQGPRQPKAVLQHALAALLPADVIRRPKVAFQTGMGLREAAAAALAGANPASHYKATYAALYGRASAQGQLL